MGIRAGVSLLELRGNACVLQTRKGLTQVEGLGFDVLKQALASVGRFGCERFARLLQQAGLDANQGRFLAEEFHRQGAFSAGRTEMLEADELLTRVTSAQHAIRIRVGPLRGSDLSSRHISSPLLQMHAFGWALHGVSNCRECISLWEIQSNASPSGSASIASSTPRRAALAIGASALREIRTAIGSLSPDTHRSIAGMYERAGVRQLRTRVAAGCSRCTSATVADADQSTDPATTAQRIIRSLGVTMRERVLPASRTRRLPIVRVAWAVASRRSDRRAAFDGNFSAQLGVGITLSERLLTARAEVIERSCAMLAEPEIRSTAARRLKHPHLPLDQWALYTPEQYASRGFPFAAVNDRTPLDWMWSTDLATGERLLVPAAFTMTCRLSTPRFVSSSSNGVATHIDRDAAIRSALLEVLERDALQRAWYCDEGAHVLTSSHATVAAPFAEHLRKTGWRLHHAWLDGLGGISVAVVIAQMTSRRGPLPANATILCAAAAGDLSNAQQRATREVVMVTEAFALKSGVPVDPELLKRPPQLRKFWNVPRLADINLLYLSPLMLPAMQRFLRAPPSEVRPTKIDDDVDSMVRRLHGEGLRVLSIDLSLPRAAPFVTHQVVVVGAQPLAFGTGVLRLGSGLLPTRLPPRSPPLPTADFEVAPGTLNPYILPLA